MGRGLSDLQKSILMLAYRNRRADCGDEPPRFHVIITTSVTVGTWRAEHELQHWVPKAFDGWPGSYWLPDGWRVAAVVDDYQHASEIATEIAQGPGLLDVRIVPAALLHGPFRRWRYADIYFCEIYHHIFGWTARDPSDAAAVRSDVQRLLPSGHMFDRQAIGEKPYSVATTVTQRACARLQARGLVVLPHWKVVSAGASLTQSGLEAAHALAVATCTSSSLQPIPGGVSVEMTEAVAPFNH